MISRYYKILELAENAGVAEIKKAYKRLAKKYHPDVNKSSDAHDRFLEISEAYEFLVNNPQVHKKDKYENRTTNKKASQAQTDAFNTQDDYFRKKAREKAEQQARMRYKHFKQQHEAFQKSGLYDVGLILRFAGNIFLLLFALALLLFPPIGMTRVVLKTHEWALLLLAIFPMIAGFFMLVYIFQNRISFFSFGNLYYTFSDVIRLYTQKLSSDKKCFYSKNQSANSKYFKVKLLKVLDVKLKSQGVRQHNVNYKNKYEIAHVPRSLKAFRIHSICTIVKLMSILLSLVFLNLESKLWAVIIGFFVGGVVSQIILFLSGTKSNTTYVFSPLFILKILTWLTIIFFVSDVQFHPFNVQTSRYIYLVIVGIFILDSPLEQIMKAAFGKRILKPMVKQYTDITKLFDSGYQLYNEIPVWTVLIPIYKWIFG